jgi:GH43 family beta-xylosidase
MSKKISILMIVVILLSALSGCNWNKSKYPETVESNLVESDDYIDHALTYDGKGLTYDKSMWYVNDLKDVPLADPHIYVEDGKYYIVGTSDRDNGVIDCYTTVDFVTYTIHKAIYDPATFEGWEADKAEIYAPEMYCFDGVYYMYYSAMDKGQTDPDGISRRRNSVVVADSPLGPYRPLQNDKVDGLASPIFLDQNIKFGVLDITVFVDDDEQMYMYYSVATNDNQHIVGVKLNSPYEADWSTYTSLVVPGALNSTNSILKPLNWEMYRSGTPIAEAPYLIKSNGNYYLTYSVNGCWDKFYNVCYAVSDSPLGNFEKPYQSGGTWTNLLLGYPGTNIGNATVNSKWSGFNSGTAHHCFFNIGDQIMIGYHAHQDRDGSGRYEKRAFAFDYLYFDKNGVPFCNGPTYSIQPLPEELSGYFNIAPMAKVESQNVTNAGAINDNYIVDCYNIPGEEEKEVSLGKGYSYIELKFDRTYEIGGIAVYNSAFYEKLLSEIVYIDFGNGNAVQYPQFSHDQYVNDAKEFIFPNSAFTIEFLNTFEADHVVICVKSDKPVSLNEIVVLGK